MKKIVFIIVLLVGFLAQAQKPKIDYTQYKKYTTAQKLAIDVSDTSRSYIVFDTDLGRFEQNYGTGWVVLSSGGGISSITGENGINVDNEDPNNIILSYYRFEEFNTFGPGGGFVTNYNNSSPNMYASINQNATFTYNNTTNGDQGILAIKRVAGGETSTITFLTGTPPSNTNYKEGLNEVLYFEFIHDYEGLRWFYKGGSSESLDFEGYNETGTRAGDDLLVLIGDYDGSSNSTKISINDSNQEVNITGFLRVENDISGAWAEFNTGLITVTRNYTLQDKSGTLALLSDIESFSEWATSTGTRAGGDLITTLGDYDDTGNGTKIIIDDAGQYVQFTSSVSAPSAVFPLLSSPSIKMDNVDVIGGYGTLTYNNEAQEFLSWLMPKDSGTLALTSDITGVQKWDALTHQTPDRWIGTQAQYDVDFPGGHGAREVLITDAAPPTLTASDISDFDTEVSNNATVTINSGKTSFPGFTSLIADYSFTDNSANWNTAYGWGDHASQSYASIGTVNTWASAQTFNQALRLTGSGHSTLVGTMDLARFGTDIFGIYKDGSNSYLALDFSALTSSKTITMPDSDVNLGDIATNNAKTSFETATDTGTTIDLSTLTQDNFGAASSATTFTMVNIGVGGYAEVLINGATEPTVTGATKFPNTASHIASTDMILCVKDFNGTRKFWFVEF